MAGLQRRGSFLFKLGGALVVAAAMDAAMFSWELGLAAFGALQLVLLVLAAAARPAILRRRAARACFGLAAIAAVAMIFDSGLLAWSLFWLFAGLGTLLPAAARFGDAWRWSQRLILHALRAVIAPLLDLRRLLRVSPRGGRGKLRRALPQLALPVLGSGVILGLFASANPVIEQVLDQALSLSPPDDWFFRLPIAAVWFAMAWSLLRPRMSRRVLGTFDGRGDLALPGVTPASVQLSLIAFNALFALQNAMDLLWLWGLAPLPKGMTLAEYAHRGAYPLVVTALLAAGFVLVALRPGSTTARMPLVRRLVIAWIAQNVLLVGNAALRTMDYIAAYSLTELRIAALLWMGLVALGLVLVMWRLLQDKSAAWLINSNAAAALALLLGCSFVDLNAVAARYNIAHARELGGSGAALDICHLQRMGVSALTALAELEQRPAPEAIHLWARLLRENAQAQLTRDLAHERWSVLGTLRLAQVRATLRKHALNPVDHGWIDCTHRDVTELRQALGLEPATPAPAPALTQPAKP